LQDTALRQNPAYRPALRIEEGVLSGDTLLISDYCQGTIPGTEIFSSSRAQASLSNPGLYSGKRRGIFSYVLITNETSLYHENGVVHLPVKLYLAECHASQLHAVDKLLDDFAEFCPIDIHVLLHI